MATNYTAKPTIVGNFTQRAEIKLDQSIQDYSEFLPAINKTESITRFFGSTVNQLLSSGSTQSVNAFWGRVSGKNYNSDQDTFIDDITDVRMNYQFQPGTVTKVGGDISSTTSYINWLNRLKNIGTDTTNHDKLFDEPGYVLDLPINIDMFINYTNYHWLEGSIPLAIIDATATDPIDIDTITAVPQYTTPVLSNFKTLEFQTGVKIKFTGDFVTSTSGKYAKDVTYYVENVGGEGGIKLLPILSAAGDNLFPSVTPYEIEIYEGWDTFDYDTTSWSGIGTFTDYSIGTTNTRSDLNLNKSYIVMERWATDMNPWARSNKWFSIYALRIAIEFNGLNLEAYLNSRTRAHRPIIEFNADMELNNTCKNYIETVDYAISLEQVTALLAGIDQFYVDDENMLQNGDIVLVAKNEPGGIEISEFNYDFDTGFLTGPTPDGAYGSAFSNAYDSGIQTAFYEEAFVVSGVGSTINLTPHNTYNHDEYVIVGKGSEKGAIYCFTNGLWGLAQNKTTRGTHPVFNLYDEAGVALESYNANDFTGDGIFGYRINEIGVFDKELGFNPSYTNAASYDDFTFDFTLNNTKFNTDITDISSTEIKGLYYWKNCITSDLFNCWSNVIGSQRVPIIQTQIADGVNSPVFDLGTTEINQTREFTISLDNQQYRWYDHSVNNLNTIGFHNPTMVFRPDIDYTLNALISDASHSLEFVDPYGNVDANITVTITGDIITLNVNSAYVYNMIIYRSAGDNTINGEIHINDNNHERIIVQKNNQVLSINQDFSIVGSDLTVTTTCENSDVIEISYVADDNVVNAVYDVAPVHFYNTQNKPFNGSGYADLIMHFKSQLNSMPGFTGQVIGDNNYYSTFRSHKFNGLIRQQVFNTSKIQYLLDQDDINPVKGLKNISNDYADFKQHFKNKIYQLWATEQFTSIRDLVDRAISDINIGKTSEFKYANSDMAYATQSRSSSYSIIDTQTTYILPKSVNDYGDTKNHVQVWLTEYDGSSDYYERQLVKDIDYTVLGNRVILTSAVTLDGIVTPATLILRWFDYKQLCHIPFSTVKLGFFKPTQVEILNGELIGHDGSIHTATGTEFYDLNSVNFDVATAALYDFELRVFNNLVDKHFVTSNVGFDMLQFYPSAHHATPYDTSTLTPQLDDWFNRFALRENITDLSAPAYVLGDQFTWNYNSVTPNLGSWRGVYMYYFGTQRPHTHPWEMLGHNVKPSWWDTNYSWAAGVKRTALLNALSVGLTGNNSTYDYINVKYARNKYDWTSDTLVTTGGVLNPPITANVISSPSAIEASKEFVFGDWGDNENIWRQSSEYKFALAKVLLQLKPYSIHELFWTIGKWEINSVVNNEQWVNAYTHTRNENFEVHNQLTTAGVITAANIISGGTGYTFLNITFTPSKSIDVPAEATATTDLGAVSSISISQIGSGYTSTPTVTYDSTLGSTGLDVEYDIDFNYSMTHLGFNTIPSEEVATYNLNSNDLSDALRNLEVAYIMHVSGFTDKRMIELLVDGDYTTGNIRVPENNYSIIIDKNAPISSVFYSGVRIEKTENSRYKVYGYDLDKSYFNYLRPSTSGNSVTEEIDNVQVTRYLKWHNVPTKIRYGHEFNKRQELFDFLIGLSEYYKSIGFNDTDIWQRDALTTIEWSLSSDTTDNFINGIDEKLTFTQGNHGVVQTLVTNYNGVHNILNKEYTQIKTSDMLVLRDETSTEFTPKNTDIIYGIGIDIVEYEHMITIDNVSEFNDEFYKPESGIGQNRIKFNGERTRNWNGKIEAPGYLIRDTGIMLNLESSVREIEDDWISSESKALEKLTRQTIGFNVGYAKPTYMKDMYIGDVSASRFEQGKRKYKGTETALTAMQRNKNIFGADFEHNIYEEWMVRLGDYGDISERNPLQFAVVPDKIKTSPQHFSFNSEFVSDRSDDLIIDMHKGSADAVSGNFSEPFNTYEVLRLDNNKISTLNNFASFTRDAGLPLVSEIDYFLSSINHIGDIYDPTKDYALIPNWSQSTAYNEGDTVRINGKVYVLNIPTTGLTGIRDDITVRGSQVFPAVANGLTLILNGTTVTFAKIVTSTTLNTIVIDGSVVNPVVPSGNTLTLDGINVNFIKTSTATTYSDIIISGAVTNPTLVNSATRKITLYYANSASPTALTSIVVNFNELDLNLTMQEIWKNALVTSAVVTDPTGEATTRLAALEALRSSYIAATSIAAWETFIDNYYDSSVTPVRYLNPEYMGSQVNANLGAGWETDARALIDLDLALIEDMSGNAATETQGTMVSGVLNNSAQFDLDRDASNNLLDNNITVNIDNGNLQDLILYIETNGGNTIATGQEVAVSTPINYVTDSISDISTKINAAITLAGVTDIASSFPSNVLTITRTSNNQDYRLGVSTDLDVGFDTNDNDVSTSGTTATSGVDLTLSEAVIAINNASITGVTAIASSNKLRIQSVNATLTIGNSTALTNFGLSQGVTTATSSTTSVPTDLAIGDVVTQINDATIANLTAKSVAGALVIEYVGATLTIGPGTANSAIGLAEQVLESQVEAIENTFNEADWNTIQDPAHFNIWTIDNIDLSYSVQLSTNSYDVFQTLDFDIGIDEICIGNESGDDAMITCNKNHDLAINEFVLIVNSTCVPSADGIHRVTGIQDDNRFYINQYLQTKGFTGKVIPIRSMKFESSTTAQNAMSDSKYADGLRTNDYVYVDAVLNSNEISLGYGAVYEVRRTTDAPGLYLVRNETGKTNNSTIKNGILYSYGSGKSIAQYEVYDPLKGIIPGIAAREIDVRSEHDKAYYNNSTDPVFETNTANTWGTSNVGVVWWDLSNAVYLNYDQSDSSYRQEYWATLFPTSTIDVYEWTKSPVTPDEYINAVDAGTVIDGIELTGTPYALIDRFDETQYYWSEEVELNATTNQIETYYYFWVKGKTTTPSINREFSVDQIANIILDPTIQQVDWLAATSANTLLVSNLNNTLGYSDAIMQVNFDTNISDYHQEYMLLGENDPTTCIPEWLHINLRDSLAGFTQQTTLHDYVTWDAISTYMPGQIVLSASDDFFRCHTQNLNNDPDLDVNNDYWTLLEEHERNPDGDFSGTNNVLLAAPQNIPDLSLHEAVKYGIETRPHQTWFKSINDARKHLIVKINDQLSQINIIDSDIDWLAEFERTFTIGGLTYDISDYWNFVDWIGEAGYIYERGVADFFITNTSELAGLSPNENDLAHVELSVDIDGRSRNQVYRYFDGAWKLIYKERATVKFNALIWDNSLANSGWDTTSWDTVEWDKSSNAIMVEIFDSLYNKIWIDEYKSLYTDIWFHMVKYVLAEQTEVDWIFKSSYINMIIEDSLEKSYNKYFNANLDELFEYINIVKPFRTKIRDATIRKLADDNATISILDTVEIRVQTNPVDDTVDETNTRSFRLTTGITDLHHSSQIVNEHKVLLGLDISPTITTIPFLKTGTVTIPSGAGAIWINGERIEYTGITNITSGGIGAGFSSGFSSGFGGVTLLTGCSRGTEGTLARSHSFADIIEDETNLTLTTQSILSDNGNTLTPAWNSLGKGLLEGTNVDANGVIINAESFGTIDSYGDLQMAQWLVLQEPAAAIESFQMELEDLIEVYWESI